MVINDNADVAAQVRTCPDAATQVRTGKTPTCVAGNPVSWTAEVMEANDYYPFGQVMPSRTYLAGSKKYRWGMNTQEKDDDINTGLYSAEFWEYDSRIGRRWNREPHISKYPFHSPYLVFANSPNVFKDIDGQDVIIAFTGGPTGGGKTKQIDDAGTTGKFVSELQKEALARGIEFSGTVIAPGWTSTSAVDNALTFIRDNYIKGEKLIIYGYSYGGDFAVELSERLKEEGITVDLLITVDASDGPAGNLSVNTNIPDNVKTNINFYQTDDSGAPSSSQNSGSSSSSSSSSDGTSGGTTDSPGSNGGANTAMDPSKTYVRNMDLTSPTVSHGNIDEVTLNACTSIAKSHLSPELTIKPSKPSQDTQPSPKP